MACCTSGCVVFLLFQALQLQVSFGERILPSDSIEISPPNEPVNGSSDDSRVLIDGIIPTPFDIATSDSWANGLITVPNILDGYIEMTFDFSELGADYLGVDTIELVIFNCPRMKIGAQSILINTGSRPDQSEAVNATLFPTSCDTLVHVCLNVSTNSPVVAVLFKGDVEVFEWIHIAEAIFFGSSDNPSSLWMCPADLLLPGTPRDDGQGCSLAERAVFDAGITVLLFIIIFIVVAHVLCLYKYRSKWCVTTPTSINTPALPTNAPVDPTPSPDRLQAVRRSMLPSRTAPDSKRNPRAVSTGDLTPLNLTVPPNIGLHPDLIPNRVPYRVVPPPSAPPCVSGPARQHLGVTARTLRPFSACESVPMYLDLAGDTTNMSQNISDEELYESISMDEMYNSKALDAEVASPATVRAESVDCTYLEPTEINTPPSLDVVTDKDIKVGGMVRASGSPGVDPDVQRGTLGTVTKPGDEDDTYVDMGGASAVPI